MFDLKGKHILVIGGAGFIGSHIVDQLLQEDLGQVTVFDNFCRGRRENLAKAEGDPRLRIIEGDLLHQDVLKAAIREADQVIHLAALWLLHCHDFPRAAFEVNIRGSFEVFEACREFGIERLVYSSSASVYGDAVELPMTEQHPFNNKTFYGASKIAGEAMLTAARHRYGLSSAALRYMNVYGPRQDDRGVYISVIMRFLERIDQGLPLQLSGDGSQTYDFIYVEDVARANLSALKAEGQGAYNVGTGRGTSIKTLAETLLRLKGSTLPLELSKTIPSFVTQRIGSTQSAAEALGFKAQVELEKGLHRLIQWREEQSSR